MTFYIFYRIIHPNYPQLNYIGSTENLHLRKITHKNRYNDKSPKIYNLKLYKFSRKNTLKQQEI